MSTDICCLPADLLAVSASSSLTQRHRASASAPSPASAFSSPPALAAASASAYSTPELSIDEQAEQYNEGEELINGEEFNIYADPYNQAPDPANQALVSYKLEDAIGRINKAMRKKNTCICSTAEGKLKQSMYITLLFILQNFDNPALSDISATFRVQNYRCMLKMRVRELDNIHISHCYD